MSTAHAETMDQRLSTVRRDVQRITAEARLALLSSSSSNAAILGVTPPGNKNNNDNDNDNDNDDTRAQAGMDLGLRLFGTSQRYTEEMGKEFDNRARTLEDEIASIRLGLKDALPSKTIPRTNVVSRGKNRDDIGDDMTTTAPRVELSMEEEVERLQTRISILQKCAQASKYLDEVDKLSLRSTNFAYTTVTSMSTNKGFNIDSPSSICSAADFIHFASVTFDNDNDNNNDDEKIRSSPMVHAARLVLDVEVILNDIVVDMSTSSVGPLQHSTSASRKDEEGDGWGFDDDGDVLDNSNDELGSSNYDDVAKMLNELRQRSRRYRMELRYRANAMIEQCIVIDNSDGIDRGLSSSSSSSGGTTLSVCGSIDDATTGNFTSPLLDAYLVLELFSDKNYPTFGETLDGAMQRLSRKLLDVILVSLTNLEANQEKESEDMRGGGLVGGYYKFTQQSVQNARSSTNSNHNKYDPVSIKGPAIRLAWTLVRPLVGDDSSSFDEHTAELEGNLESLLGTDINQSMIATSDVIYERALRAFALEVSQSGASFLAALNFVTTIITFIHHHALLSRPDLASMLGKHLFGTYPIVSNDSILSSGSVMLNVGVLLGAAAHDIENGDTMPLMTALVKYMRRCCIPTARSPEVWQTLQKMECRIVVEVMAFEEKLVGMNMLNDSSKSSTIDEYDTSPIFNMQQPKILSPLSELVVSLRQAYTEGQRSQVLIRGRSILLETDYHNTVQVGIDVPEPSDPGTLAYIDDDPLKTFAFHKCSISITAQRIMELCRSTLDDATTPIVVGGSDLGVDDTFSPMLYRASRELLDLFRAIIPTVHAREVGSIPRIAAVLHNDCVYLAHESGLLGAEYKIKFRNLNLDNDDSSNSSSSSSSSSNTPKGKTRLLGEICSFLDMIPPFRDLATKCMGSMIEKQKCQLYELVAPRLLSFQEALTSNESVIEWDDADTALRAALFHMRHLSQSWKLVLARNVYCMAVGNLVDMILILFLDPVLKSDAITEAASRFIHSLFFDAVRGVADFFVIESSEGSTTKQTNSSNETLSGNDNNNNMQERSIQLTKKYSTLLDKTRAVGNFMAMRLDEIQRGLEEGKFSSVNARELSHLITAAFDDSKKRTILLNDLASR